MTSGPAFLGELRDRLLDQVLGLLEADPVVEGATMSAIETGTLSAPGHRSQLPGSRRGGRRAAILTMSRHRA